jgi:multiple sugar transport system permease protein
VRFVGLANYREILVTERFWKAVYNTFFLMLGTPIGIACALMLALALNRRTIGSKLFRVIYYLPSVSSVVAISILWTWIYNYDYGILNTLLRMVFGVDGPNWLYDPTWIKPSLILMGVWRSFGATAIFYLAALQNIPQVYYEAAKIDGAGPWQSFWRVTLPLITPITFYLLVMGVIGNMQSFAEIHVMLSNGGTEYSGATIVYFLWQKAFQNYEMGFACAVAWILGSIIFILTLLQFKTMRHWVYDGS